jgi:hypothetical protein
MVDGPSITAQLLMSQTVTTPSSPFSKLLQALHQNGFLYPTARLVTRFDNALSNEADRQSGRPGAASTFVSGLGAHWPLSSGERSPVF